MEEKKINVTEKLKNLKETRKRIELLDRLNKNKLELRSELLELMRGFNSVLPSGKPAFLFKQEYHTIQLKLTEIEFEFNKYQSEVEIERTKGQLDGLDQQITECEGKKNGKSK